MRTLGCYRCEMTNCIKILSTHHGGTQYSIMKTTLYVLNTQLSIDYYLAGLVLVHHTFYLVGVCTFFSSEITLNLSQLSDYYINIKTPHFI